MIVPKKRSNIAQNTKFVTLFPSNRTWLFWVLFFFYRFCHNFCLPPFKSNQSFHTRCERLTSRGSALGRKRKTACCLLWATPPFWANFFSWAYVNIFGDSSLTTRLLLRTFFWVRWKNWASKKKRRNHTATKRFWDICLATRQVKRLQGKQNKFWESN